MATLANSLVSSSARPLGLRMRADLSVRQHRYRGRSYWVVKEPIGLKYYRFQEEEFAILQMLDGQTSLDEIKERFEEEFAPQKITLQDLQQFMGMLHRSGLAISDTTGQGRQLVKRRREQTRKRRMQAASSVLSIRFKGIDPEWLLNRMYPYFRWCFSPVIVILCCILALSALSLVIVQFDVFRSRLPTFNEFFASGNWLWLALTLAVTKVIHEFGHGLSCKHFGGECHEMGVMLLVLTPCLYCNVSDSWMLPSKWRRAAIGAAGMYVEIVISSIATFVWWFSEPGLLNHLCLRIMFISSVSTLLFNGNPLLRYDGYYILSDLIEIPNLRQKASEVLKRIMSKWCLGIEQPENPFLPQGNQALFAIFTVASNLYRWFVVLSIMFFLNKVFEPYGLKIIGQMIAMVGIFGLVVMPLWQLGRFLYVPGRMDQVKLKNVYVTMGVAASIIALVALVPLPHHVKCSLEVRPSQAESIYTTVPGRLVEVLVEPGDKVKANQPLANLVSLDLQLDVSTLEGQRDKAQTQLVSLQHQLGYNTLAANQLDAAEKALNTIQDQLEGKKKDLERLQLVAPIDGTVLPPASRPKKPPGDGALPNWSGSPLQKRNLGVHLAERDIFCEVGNPEKLEVEMVIDQTSIEYIRVDDPIRVMLEAQPGRIYESKIIEIARGELKVAPQGQSTHAGGEVDTRTDASGVQRPMSTSYQARAPLETLDFPVQIGMRGFAKIYVGKRSLGTRLWRYLARTFHFEL